MGKKEKLSDKTPNAYEFVVHPKGTLKLRSIDPGTTLGTEKKEYEKELKKLQEKLYELQVRYFLEKRRAVIVFEGWDAAGKGGAIKRLTALMDPRGYKVWPIAAPKDAEARHHYLWRFTTRTPEQGELSIFDRSWYGRVLVERMLTDDGVVILKFFLHIDKETQLERFKAREKDPINHFKIGPDDWRNRKRRPDYEEAIQDVFDRTHRPDAPWHVVPANDKKYARIAVLRTCIDALDT
ncbi:MAG: polyphosphate kinase [Myxococcaceae bacterium]|nr:polyphosphate kinase [Myxococcaceae bacterium]